MLLFFENGENFNDFRRGNGTKSSCKSQDITCVVVSHLEQLIEL